MNNVKGNINLANMMIDSSHPTDLESSDNCLNQMMGFLGSIEEKICDLIVTLNSKDASNIVRILVLVLDDYNQTLMRYN